MNVVVLSTHPRWITHFGTELEIIQRHLDDHDSVVHLHCDGVQQACDFNPEHSARKCRKCIQVCDDGLKLLSAPVPSIPFTDLSPADREELAGLPNTFASLDDLRAVRIDNFDIGWATLSSVISSIRDPKPDLSRHADLVRRFMNAAFVVYRSVQHYLDRHPVDRVYVFNGRFASCRAVLRACQSRGVTCLVHERGCDLRHYALYRNTLPIDSAYVGSEIAAYWSRASADPKRDEIGSRFFLARSKGQVQNWYSFVASQKAGLLPENWDAGKTNIVIFNSSEDEFAAIGDEWKNPLYANQRDGLRLILASLQGWSERFHVYLRMHPNLRKVDNEDVREVLRLTAPFLTVIPPDSPVSTYALLESADRVLTFGSSAGIEAVYWGTPSILAGHSLYRELGGTYNPASHDELVTLLKSDLPPKDKTPALMFGYYYATYGMPYRYYRATSVTHGTFREQPLPRPYLLGELARKAKRVGRYLSGSRG